MKEFSLPSWQQCIVIGFLGYVGCKVIGKLIETFVPAAYQKYVS